MRYRIALAAALLLGAFPELPHSFRPCSASDIFAVFACSPTPRIREKIPLSMRYIIINSNYLDRLRPSYWLFGKNPLFIMKLTNNNLIN